MATKTNRFDYEWWIVPKRLVYLVIILVSLSIVAGGVGVYVWLHGNPFKGAASDASAPTGARFISFEGGVRVVRANTREVVPARSDTRLKPRSVHQMHTIAESTPADAPVTSETGEMCSVSAVVPTASTHHDRRPSISSAA